MRLSDWLGTRGVEAPDFAKRIGVSARYLNMLKRGVRRPSLELMDKIARRTQGAVTFEDWLNIPSARARKPPRNGAAP
jgi:transcriptional regulator with XRE-family HTH domain